jgi:AcrR family transcriptional regulator
VHPQTGGHLLDLPYSYPGSNPLTELSPTAQRILQGAKRILAREGFKGLTFEALAAESGENKALIAYHFGNKAGLLVVLVDSVVHDANATLVNEIKRLPEGNKRTQLLINSHRVISGNGQAYQLFFELLPYIFRDPQLTPRLAVLYRWYRDLDAWALLPRQEAQQNADLRALSALTVAVTDGLALQHASDPDFDIRAPYDLWERLIKQLIEASPTFGGEAADKETAQSE